MIDLGFTKIVVVGVIALIVLGPERLPQVARTLGAWLGRLQRYLNHLKTEVSHDLEIGVLRKVRDELTQTVTTIQQQTQAPLRSLVEERSEGRNVSAEINPTGSFTVYRRERKNSPWRQRRALPKWFRRHTRLRSQILSGAARVYRYRAVNRRAIKSFF